MSKTGKKTEGPSLRISSEVVRQIRQHARSCDKSEVCGVLIGREEEGIVTIEACIAGANAAQGGAHVTFTQDTWEHIYKIKDREYPDKRILGWYHSHPGFGVFLSDHDAFIHKNFFSSPQQVAWVYDPQSDEEGCFGWVGQRLERLAQLSLTDSKGGEDVGEGSQPEPAIHDIEDDPGAKVSSQLAGSPSSSSAPRIVGTIFSYLSIFLLGILVAWYIFPRVVILPIRIDSQTNQPTMSSPPGDPGQPPADQGGAHGRSTQPHTEETKRGNGTRR